MFRRGRERLVYKNNMQAPNHQATANSVSGRTPAAALVVVAGEASAVGTAEQAGAWRLRGRQHQASARAAAEAPKAAAAGAEAKEETECAAREVKWSRTAESILKFNCVWVIPKPRHTQLTPSYACDLFKSNGAS